MSLNDLFQTKFCFREVVSKWSHPSLVRNYSILDDVESFWCSTISNICRVEHCINHHWNPSRTVRQEKLGSCASFLNRPVLAYLVVVLKENATTRKISPSVYNHARFASKSFVPTATRKITTISEKHEAIAKSRLSH